MPLPGPLELAAVLRADDPTIDAESVLLDDLVTQATAAVQAFLDRPIAATAQTFHDVAARADGQSLRIPMTPVRRTGPAPVVTDLDGTAVTGFRVNPRTGVLAVTRDSTADFGNGPFTIVATVGLETRDDYTTVVEPALSRAILDLAADWFERRTAAATMEAAGGGAFTQYAQDIGIPKRVKALLAPFARVPF